jgi:O-antigen/teichoic acid export membrane protein
MTRRLSELRPLMHRPRLRGSALTVGGVLGGAVLAFAATIIAARSLSSSQLAAFGVGLAVNSLAVQLSDFGLNTLTVAETAPGWASGAEVVPMGKLRQIAVRRVAAALGVSALLIAVSFLVPDFQPYRSAFAVSGAGAVLGAPSLFAIASLQAARQFGLASTILVSVGVVRLAGVAAAAAAGLGATSMLAGYAVAGPFVGGILGLIFLHRQSAQGVTGLLSPQDEGYLDRGMTRTTATTATLGAALLNLDVLVLALVAGEHQVAIYVAAWRIAGGVLLFDTAIANAVLPYVFLAEDIWSETKRLARLGLLIAGGLLVATPALTIVGLLLLGDAGHGAAAPLALLLVAFSLDAFVFATYQVYYRLRHFRFAVWLSLGELIVMLGFTLALQQHGALAPAIGQLAARVFAFGMIAVPIVSQRLGSGDWFSTRPNHGRQHAEFAAGSRSLR